MNHLKSLFVSAFSTAAAVGMAAGVALAFGGDAAWWGAAIACGAPALFFGYVFIAKPARTSANLHWMPGVGAAGSALALGLGGPAHAAVWLGLVVGVFGSLAYIFWYSRFDPAPMGVAQGEALPDITLHTPEGHAITRDEITAQPALLMFYRGNWCPFCMAQIREVAAQYRALAERGVAMYMISPQPDGNTESLAKKFDVPMHFVTDRDNAAAKALGIFVEGGLPAGLQALGYDSDVPRPTVLITDAHGTIVYSDVTENYRVRPEPADYIRVLDSSRATGTA